MQNIIPKRNLQEAIAIIEWNKDLEIGIELIDKQHKEFFVKAYYLLNDLKIEDESLKREKTNEFIAFLKSYFIYHFEEEEKFQQSINYTGYEEHREKHQAFIEKIENIISELNKEDAGYRTYLKLHNNVLNWFSDHISYDDYRIKEFLDKKDEPEK